MDLFNTGSTLTLADIQKLLAPNSILGNKAYDASNFNRAQLQADAGDGGNVDRLYEYAVPDGKGGIQYVSLQGIGETADDGFKVVQSQDFKTQDEFDAWGRKNNEQSGFLSAMEIIMPLVVGGTMAGGLLGAFDPSVATAGVGEAAGIDGIASANLASGAGITPGFSFSGAAGAGIPGTGAAAGLLGGESFTLDPAMLDPLNPASGIADLTAAGTNAAADYLSTAMGALPGVSGPYTPSVLDRIINYAQNNPLNTIRGVNAVANLASNLTANNDDGGGGGGSRKPLVIDQSIVDKYSGIPALAPVNYQQFHTLPDSLLGKPRKSLLGG